MIDISAWTDKFLQVLTQNFGERIWFVGLQGSYARGETTETSDIDIYVETETPNPFLIVRMKAYLEKLLGCSVDVIRAHKNMNAFLKQQIEKDGIHVF